jgi:hypothetical protein
MILEQEGREEVKTACFLPELPVLSVQTENSQLL